MTPCTVRHSKVFAVIALVVGALLLVASVLSVQPISIVAGAVLTLLGILMLVNPLLRIEYDEVRLHNPLGLTVKRFPVTSPADLRFEGKVLRHAPTGSKIASLGSMADKSDVAHLRGQIPSGLG